MPKRPRDSDDAAQPSTSNGNYIDTDNPLSFDPPDSAQFDISSNENIPKISKNSLDSDEEDEEQEVDKYKLNPFELEGQENATIERDGDIKITPFNMVEEQEIGHIDKEGAFIFSREKPFLKDSWVDNIDSVKVSEVKKPSTAHLFESDLQQKAELDPLEHYRSMLELMEPKETVTKALRRLGGNKSLSVRERWRRKKEGTLNDEVDQEKREKFDKLTSLANDIINSGNMDIYQYTYEKLKHLISVKEEKKNAAHLTATEDDALDMFGESFDEKYAAESDAKRMKVEENNQENKNDREEVRWEYKWENKESAEVYGPYSNSEMLHWQTEGYFKDGVWVRKAGNSEAPFYSSKRIDFELYET